MASLRSFEWLIYIILSINLLINGCYGVFSNNDDRRASMHIVYMGDRPNGEFSASSLHTSVLQEALGSDASDALVHSYHKSFNGFAAKLTKDEVQKLAGGKIIGARYYRSDGIFGEKDIISPRDSNGHGSHTSSTAAGASVRDASLFGLGSGTARGGVPSARIAVYKICWFDGCFDADILAAFDDAIADGVDIISLSVGGSTSFDYFNDSIAIGAFHSMKNGILTSNSAGNSGPGPATITNLSPWSLSVAASTIDRKFLTQVKLGNGEVYEGISVNTFNLDEKFFPVIHGRHAPNKRGGFTSDESRYCEAESLDKKLVRNKIVLCDWSGGDGSAASIGGSSGIIMQDEEVKDFARLFPIPASTFNPKQGDEISLYPDLTAPGVDILAAWSEATSPTRQANDKRVVSYNIISGTSMSCPHATAAAAYVKSFNPTWSPAAIKSALMTSAYPLSDEINKDAEFAYGSGHIDPLRSIRPGLVYDAGESDYVEFLCGQGYSTKSLRLVTGDKSSSCSKVKKLHASDLNYPSFALSTTSTKPITRTFHRTVTNVGSPASTYNAIVKSPKGMKVIVKPRTLCFDYVGQKKSFVVKVRARVDANDRNMISGALVWDDGDTQVRSPIVAYYSSSTSY
ncbi:hypothetical protein CsatB_009338 [Cannabis sativa]